MRDAGLANPQPKIPAGPLVIVVDDDESIRAALSSLFRSVGYATRLYPSAAAFAEAGLPGRYAIGCFGRVRAQKGSDVFVEAMCRLLPRYPDFTAVMVGAIVASWTAHAQRRVDKFRISPRGQARRASPRRRSRRQRC